MSLSLLPTTYSNMILGSGEARRFLSRHIVCVELTQFPITSAHVSWYKSMAAHNEEAGLVFARPRLVPGIGITRPAACTTV